MDNSMFMFIDIIIVISGVYLIYGAVQLKRDSTLPGSIWNKDLPLRKCKDLPGFTAFMFPRLIISGIIVMAVGLIGVLADRYESLTFLIYISMGLVVVIMVWYILFTKKAQKMFF